MVSHPLHVTSEIGKLRTVMLHRPGKEVENLTPEYLPKLLFDDIPYVPIIQKEHDYFATTLRNRGIDVLYLKTLLTEALQEESIKIQFVTDVLYESKITVNGSFHTILDYLLSFPTETMIEKIMAGILKTEIKPSKKTHLYEMLENHYPFYLTPMTNLYFTRDPAAVIGNGITINSMREGARKRESIFMSYIINHHPRFAEQDIPIWFNRDFAYPMEGGDELVLSEDTLAIGISSRTAAKAIERFALNIFDRQATVKKILAVEIPKSRAFMHLDTVFTMVDFDIFTIHPEIQGPAGDMNIYVLERGDTKEVLKITPKTNLRETLKEVLHLQKVTFIPCGRGDIIAGPREQWNDGSNTLAIAPGVVITYDRNYVSNQLLREYGIEVIEVISSELSRGRGGPRCMSMPMIREEM